MSLLQQTLLEGVTPAQILERYAVKSKRSTKHPSLVQFKYDQINSPFAEPLVRECRGIILDENDNWRVIARAFDKFFNAGEHLAAPIDWPTAKVQEKVDGSLILLYYYGGQWNAATMGSPDAAGAAKEMLPNGEEDGAGDAPGDTFGSLFWKTWRAYGWPLPDDTTWTYLFELTSPITRIVVDHKEAGLTWLGMRNPETGEERAPTTQYRRVREFPLRTFDDVLATFAAMKPLEQEGYVICDASFNRIKVKHPGYVELHHLKGETSPRRVLELVRLGEIDELLAYFPHLRAMAEDFSAKYKKLLDDIMAVYGGVKGIAVQKDYAAAVLNYPFSGVLFMLRSGKVTTVEEWARTLPIDKLMGYVAERG